MAANLVLVVDDDPVFTRFTQDLLAGNGHEVVTAFNKAEALEIFEKHHPSCAILDIFLPDGSGVDLIRPLRAGGSTTPIIMVSGQSDVEEVVRAMKDGANDYIKKPFRGEELLLKLQMVLEASQTKWELEELRSKVRAEDEYKLLFSLGDRMHKVQAIVDQVANTDITVLITGESGTGKELVAKALHKASERLVVPWKYGFKGIKAIVKIEFVAQQPTTTWMLAAPDEYGFYANVNPHVDHPRWTQAVERRIGEFRRRPTLMFNGYGDQVASMYAGMDLRKYF